MPGDDSTGILPQRFRLGQNIQHRRGESLVCGGLSPLSAGDLSPSEARVICEPLKRGSAGPTSRPSGQSGDKSPALQNRFAPAISVIEKPLAEFVCSRYDWAREFPD